jgi:cold shock CspA family protein
VVPDDGGDDVFIHANDVGFDKGLLVTGARLSFEKADGRRGAKAWNIELVEPAPPAREIEKSAAGHSRTVDDGLCDVLTAKEFTEEVTEVFLTAAPSITAGALLAVRQHLLQFAYNHGWIEG